MRIKLVLTTLAISASTFAQDITFEQVRPLAPGIINEADFEGLDYASLAFGDVDNDGDKDVVLSGEDISGVTRTLLYLNNGSGSFYLQSTSVQGASNGTVNLADVDGDNDLDLLVTGTNGFTPNSNLYVNDGTGGFSPHPLTSLEGVWQSDAAFCDIDGDNDLDLILAGVVSGGNGIANVYRNNGTGHYSLDVTANLTGVKRASIATGDINGDSDIDVVVTGLDNAGNTVSTVYENNGSGSLTTSTNSLMGVWQGDIALADLDGDNDLDLFLLGESGSGIIVAVEYVNDGVGVFTQHFGNTFEGVKNGSITIADVDNDQDNDLLVTGMNNSSFEFTELYLNNGTGSFYLPQDNPFQGVWLSGAAFEDVDQDSDLDLMIVGAPTADQKMAKLYLNNGLGEYKEVSGTPFPSLLNTAVDFTDVDGDNDVDMILMGNTKNDVPFTELYLNDGYGNYTPDQLNNLHQLGKGDAQFHDVNNDNHVDIVISGRDQGGQRMTKVYLNDGAGEFTEHTSAGIGGFFFSDMDMADVDNDGDLDLIIGGVGPNGAITSLYLNSGNGDFTEDTNNSFVTVVDGVVEFTDLDNDGNVDLIVMGGSGANTLEVYLNDGQGGFSVLAGSIPAIIAKGDLDFADIDGDGDQDLIITGEEDLLGDVVHLYQNDGSGYFSQLTNNAFPGGSYSSVDFNDIDNDGDQDLLIVGVEGDFPNGSRFTSLYLNDGLGNFSTLVLTHFEGTYQGCARMVNFDGDNKVDVFISGSANDGAITKMYRNLGLVGVVETAQNNLNIYPNPVQDVLHVPGQTGICSITDINGRIFSKELINEQLDVSELAKGVYYLKFKGVSVIPFIKL